MQDSRGTLYESWKVVSEKEMRCRSYKLHGADTIVLENVQLVERDSGIFYIPIVSDQNDRKPIPFRLIDVEKNSYTFENKRHDFPQRVIYKLVSQDSMFARIEGTLAGSIKASDFRYRRVPGH
jgi:hypothetical protein